MLQEAGGEEDEPRRLAARLGTEQDAGLLAATDRVRVGGDDLTEEGVQPAGGDARLPARQRRLDRRDQLLHVAAGERRDVHPGRPRDLLHLGLDLALEVVAALLVELVPLVVRDHDGAARLDGHRDDALVLDADGLGGVDQDHRDLRLLDGGGRAQGGVVVGALLQVHLLADTGGVDELPGDATEFDQLVDRVAGGAGQLVDDDAVLLRHLVQERGLADVRAADQRDAARAARGGAAEGLRGGLGQGLQDGVEHVAGAAAVQRGDRVRHTEAERPQGGRVGFAALAVDLVGAQHDGLARLAQQAYDGLVGVGGADLGVDDEDDRVGGLDGVLGLGGDGGVDAEDVLLPAAGVDDLEAAAGPFGLVRDAVAGDAGLVLDDRLAAADDPVHQGRLADIRAADDGEDGKRAVTGLLDRAFDLFDVEALFRGELHELRVLGIAKCSVVVLVVHEVRSSSFVVVGGTRAARFHYWFQVSLSAR